MSAPPTRRLRRSRDNRMVAGVCGGIARYLGVDAKWVRLLTVAGVVLGLGSVAVLYVVAWALLPED
jgi:phage shock protein C